MRPREGTEAVADLSALVARALDGDQPAWEALCRRVRNVAWKVIYTEGLRGADAEDAFAATFFRLAEKLHTVRDPQKLPGWLATTARNECRAVRRARQRYEPRAETPEPVNLGMRSDEHVIELELKGAVAAAFGELSAQCQRLLRLLSAVPPLSYGEIADLLGGVPVGSIGPTRGRCLDRMRTLLAAGGFTGGM